jgi:hypothetical protein
MENNHYPAKFKADAVALRRSSPSATTAHIANDLSVNDEALHSWVWLDDQRRGLVGLPGVAARPQPARHRRGATTCASFSLPHGNPQSDRDWATCVNKYKNRGTKLRESECMGSKVSPDNPPIRSKN